MNHYFITGTSRGIGKAIAEQLLLDPKNFVTGLSRTSAITHERYTHVEIDLSDLEKVSQFNFPVLERAEKISLVNNAGAIGKVFYVGKIPDDLIKRAYNLNLVAPTILTNSFLNFYSSNPAKQIIINVSSGAGKNAIDGWSVYCATKAGLDMFTKVVAEELKIADRKNVFIFAVAPGVVDTNMQDEIRTADQTNFSNIQRFIEYKKTNQLASPDFVAGKYLAILELPEKFKDVLFSVKDI
jgi:benzil reductase ((S)-benzoin forming)